MTAAETVTDNNEGMSYLESLPRRALRIYLPLGVIMFFLLFPFYWMATTTFKPDAEMYDYEKYNPFWIVHPTLAHIKKLLFDTDYPLWMYNTVVVSVSLDLYLAVCKRLRRLCDRAPSLQGLALRVARDLSGLSGATFDPVYSAGRYRVSARVV